jgi:hypothetical protein
MEESGHMAVSKQPMLLEVVRKRIRLKHYPKTGSRTRFGSSIHAMRIDTDIRKVLAPKQPFGWGALTVRSGSGPDPHQSMCH